MAEAASNTSVLEGFLELNKEQRDGIIGLKNADNTHRSTNTWITRLNAFVKKKQIGETLKDVSDDDLPDLIENFYAVIKKPGGSSPKDDTYKNSSLKVMRAGINRHLKDKRRIDMLIDPRFNSLLKGLLKTGKAKGLGTVKHKASITDQDMERLNDYFSKYMQPNALILARYVQFCLMFFLCRRGRENLTYMEIDTFDVSTEI